MRKNGEDVEPFFPYYHMVLLAKNIRGWRALSQLTSESYRSGFYKKPCIDDELLDRYAEDLIISTSCPSGFIPRAILRGDDAAVKRHVEKLTRWAGEDWYFEGQPHDFDDLRVLNPALWRLSVEYGRPLVAARDAHAPDDTWIETQHVSVKMRTRGSMVTDPTKAAEEDEKYDLTVADTAYIASAEQTLADFARYHPLLDRRVVEEAVRNTGWVVNRVVPWSLDRSPKLPLVKGSAHEDDQELRRRVYAGLERLGHDKDPRYVDGVEKELALFVRKRFSSYFLIVDDMIRGCAPPTACRRASGIRTPCRPRRPRRSGSGGAAPAAAVPPTRSDHADQPRHLRPQLRALPQRGPRRLPRHRHRPHLRGAELAKEWLKRTRGKDRVYDMIAHSTFGAREALRRVGMVYEIPHAQLNALSKQIPDDESDLSLDVLRDHVPELERYAEANPKAFAHAARLQKSNSKITEHASAVVVSDRPLDEFIPVMRKSAKDDYLVTAFGDAAGEETISKLGLLKIDLLVVVALARQAYAEQLIGRVHDVHVDLDTLPALEDPEAADPKAMEIFCVGAKNGIFQWDGKSNMASLTKRIKPTTINHLAAANAGVRPGVSQHAPEYVNRRHGAPFEYWDPAVEPALHETFGLPLYQEQIMAIFQMLGGYSASEADTVRRIMGKYYRIKGGVAAEMLAEHHDRFVASAASVCRGGRQVADQIWAYCGDVSDYLFNGKSHADEYALIAHGDAWLKAHYPDAFYASLLTFPPAWVKKPENRNAFYERTVREARHFGVDVLPPDVNESDQSFTIRGDAVLFGLSGIKGLGPAMVADVINNRPFTSLEDMGLRLTACNKAGRQALGAAGALDRFGARGTSRRGARAARGGPHRRRALGRGQAGADPRPAAAAAAHRRRGRRGAQRAGAGGRRRDRRRARGQDPEGSGAEADGRLRRNEYKVSVPPWDYEAGTTKGDDLRALIASDEPVVVRGSKDVEYDCVAADEIKDAREVLEMMQTREAV
jgi:DNA polymerase-3 subunit alpha